MVIVINVATTESDTLEDLNGAIELILKNGYRLAKKDFETNQAAGLVNPIGSYSQYIPDATVRRAK